MGQGLLYRWTEHSSDFLFSELPLGEGKRPPKLQPRGQIFWTILVTDFHLLKSLLVVFGFGSQAFFCEFSRQNICSVDLWAMCKLIFKDQVFYLSSFSILFSLKNINIKAHYIKLHNQTNAFMSAERGFCKKYAVSSKMCTPPILEIKCKDNCSLWVLDEIIEKKIFWKFEKKLSEPFGPFLLQQFLGYNNIYWSLGFQS